MSGFALNASLVKGAVSVSMIGSNLRVRSAKEAKYANMDGIGMCVKSAVEHPCASMIDIDIRAQNAKEPEYVIMEKENSAAVNVEEPPCANMDVNALNANPAADPRIANMTSFVTRVSSAHPK